MTTGSSTQSEDGAPNVAIRARPPSPRRLSRKVLLGGGIAASAIVAFALMSGLSIEPRPRAAREEASPTASGPPESIAQASSQYDAVNFTRIEPALDVPRDGAAGDLQPPADPTFANASPAALQTAAAAPQGRPRPQGDPEGVARAAPILFAASANRSEAMSAEGRDQSEANLDASLIPPRSPYALISGSVIPAALLTGLNSDLAGRVIAQVTAPVYDSVSGEHLLIPQGSRLIGSYDNGVRYGDRRILLDWNRLILPNGWSINLRQMNASDPSGASGLSDAIDNHLGPLARAIGLSSIISVIANNSENDQRAGGSFAQSVGDAAAQEAAQTGSQVIERELNVHPTLAVRAGANVRVLVMRDITLRPYQTASP